MTRRARSFSTVFTPVARRIELPLYAKARDANILARDVKSDTCASLRGVKRARGG